MKLKEGLFCSFFQVLLILALSASGVGAQAQSVWPFDQRQILLVQTEGQKIPEALTLAQILDVFRERGRVRWVTQKAGPGQIVPVEVPRDFAWQSSPSVRSLGLRYKVDGILVVQGQGAQIDLRWYSTLDGQPLFFESLYLPAAGPKAGEMELRRKRLRDWLLDLWGKIPGHGYVVKRDMSSLQLEGAQVEGLKEGDQLEILRLMEVQRHPLLKTVVSIRSSVTGTATVTALGEPFSPARVDYESQLDPIREGDRYRVVPKVEDSEGALEPQADGKDSFLASPAPGSKFLDLNGRIGWASLKHEESTASESYGLKAQGPALLLNTRVYLTKAWIGGMDLTVGWGHYKTPPADYGSSPIESGWSQSRFYSGYRLLFDEASSLGAAEILFTAGYRKFQAKAEGGEAALAPSTKIYTGIDLGLELRMPVLEGWLVQVNMGRVLGTALNEEPDTSGESSQNGLWSVDGGLHWQLRSDASLGAGVALVKAISRFKGDGTRATAALKSELSATAYYLSYEHRF